MHNSSFESSVNPDCRATGIGPEGKSSPRPARRYKAAGRFGTAFCLTVLLLSPAVLARQDGKKGQKTPEPKAAAPKTETEEAAALKAAERAQALQRVRGLEAQFLEMKRADVRVVSVARLADLLWKDDEVTARQLFSKALEMCAPKGGDPPAEAASKATLRRNVLSILVKRDAVLVKRLIDEEAQDSDEAGATARAGTDFKIAYDFLKTEPDKSIEFAERSLRGGIPEGLYSLLLLLRQKDSRAADALFLKAVERLQAQPVVDADSLLLLGTYVFTAPTFNPNDPATPPDIVRVVGVGRYLVYDITADRPNVQREIVRAYLAAATRILLRTNFVPAERPKMYAAAYLLLPKTERYAPELSQSVISAMQQLVSDVPPELTQEAAYSNFKANLNRDLDDSLKSIEKEGNAQKRDEQYLILIADLWRQPNLARARSLNAKISDEETRASLATLIDFKEAAERLAREKDLGASEEAIRKLPRGVEQALLWLGLARAQAEAGQSQRASDSLNEALQAARGLKDARGPFIILSAAGQLAKFYPPAAEASLVEAVRLFNAQSPEAVAQMSWEQHVETGRIARDFPLAVKGVDLSFRQSFSALAVTNPDVLIEASSKLNNERLRASALISIAAAMLA